MTVSAGLGGGGISALALGGAGAAGGVGGLASTGAGNTAELIALGIVLVATGFALVGLSARRRVAVVDQVSSSIEGSARTAPVVE